MKIVEWHPTIEDPGYYGNIHYAEPSQQACFEKICHRINNNEYVDIGDNDAYLYAYINQLRSSIKNRNRGRIDYENGESIYIPSDIPLDKSIYRDACKKIQSFIKLYEEQKPQVIQYIYPTLLFTDLFMYGNGKQLSDDLNTYFSFMLKHNITEKSVFPAIFYILVNNAKENDYIDSSYYPIFFGTALNEVKNGQDTDAKERILANIPLVLEADYQENGINYLYRMYEWIDGTIADGIDQPPEFFEEKILDTKIPYRQFYDDNFYIDNILVPKNKDDRKKYTSAVIRVAQNLYREDIGVPLIGEGWISETLLFRQIEAAFPDDNVEQHSRPYFLGRQHYDVYIPKYRIALEYQGAQHFNPVAFFGGEESFARGQENDQRKRDISHKNGVTLIEVLPGYKIEDILAEVLSHMIDKNAPEYMEQLSIATNNAKSFSRHISISKASIGKTVSKNVRQNKRKAAEKEFSDIELDQLIAERISKLFPSDYADPDWMSKISTRKWNTMLKRMSEVEALSKEDPEKAYKAGLDLMKYGYYAPIIYGRMAIILRKLKRTDEELQMLLQMKRDFGYDHYDERIRNLLRSKTL